MLIAAASSFFHQPLPTSHIFGRCCSHAGLGRFLDALLFPWDYPWCWLFACRWFAVWLRRGCPRLFPCCSAFRRSKVFWFVLLLMCALDSCCCCCSPPSLYTSWSEVYVCAFILVQLYYIFARTVQSKKLCSWHAALGQGATKNLILNKP